MLSFSVLDMFLKRVNKIYNRNTGEIILAFTVNFSYIKSFITVSQSIPNWLFYKIAFPFRNTEDSTFVHEFSENLLLRLMNASLKASEDSEKVRCNIVRTLGNLAKYLSQKNVEKQVFQAALEKKFEVLSKCILNGQMKTRWNACYAAGNVYSNLSLPNGKTIASV